MNIFLRLGLSVLLFQATSLKAMHKPDAQKKETVTGKNHAECNSSTTNQSFAQKATLLEQAEQPSPQLSNFSRQLVGLK